MEQQTIINISVGAILGVLGWFARVMWDSVNKLRDDIHEIEIALPSHYVRRDEFFDAVKLINDKLDRIYDKLEGKADKRGE